MAGRSLGTAVLLVCVLALAQKPEPVDTSICTITAHPSRFHNKNVRVRGTASSGMEASFLIVESKDGQWNKQWGQINLDFHSARSDESTSRFLQWFPEQLSPPKCDKDEELRQGLAHALDPSVPAPRPCFATLCYFCPRYSIIATFTGRLRYSGKEPGHSGFGHLGMFNLQLDVTSASDLDVTDMAAHPKP